MTIQTHGKYALETGLLQAIGKAVLIVLEIRHTLIIR